MDAYKSKQQQSAMDRRCSSDEVAEIIWLSLQDASRRCSNTSVD